MISLQRMLFLRTQLPRYYPSRLVYVAPLVDLVSQWCWCDDMYWCVIGVWASSSSPCDGRQVWLLWLQISRVAGTWLYQLIICGFLFFLEFQGKTPRPLHHHKDQSNSLSIQSSTTKLSITLNSRQLRPPERETKNDTKEPYYIFHSLPNSRRPIHFPLDSTLLADASIRRLVISAG
jgi:hypothetical protein